MSTTITDRGSNGFSFQATAAGSPYSFQSLGPPYGNQSGRFVQENLVSGTAYLGGDFITWGIHCDNWSGTSVTINGAETITKDTVLGIYFITSVTVAGPGTVVFTRQQILGNQPNHSPSW
jgi:hypothetical protein